MNTNWVIKPIVPEEIYTDRQECLDYLYQAALQARTRRTRSTALLGQRRIGKTEIFKRVVNRLFFEQDHLDPKAVVPIYYNFVEVPKNRWDFALDYVENFMRWYVAFRLHDPKILLQFFSYKELLAIIREKISFKTAVKCFASLQTQEATNPEQEALYLPRQVSEHEDSTIVMFLDNFQNTRLPQYKFDVVDYMQEAAKSPTCPHFVTSSPMNILEQEILGQGFERHPIGPLTDYWATELARRTAKYYEANLSEELALVVAKRCGGHPFYITAVTKQAAELNQAILTEYDLNTIFARDLSSGFIWSELSYQVYSWIERINEYDLTKWILYLSAIQKGDQIDLKQIQQDILEKDFQTVPLEKIREVLIKLSRGDFLDYSEPYDRFRKFQDPILLEFLRVWGRIEVEGHDGAMVREDLQYKYQKLNR
jgi:hypothetical protein